MPKTLPVILLINVDIQVDQLRVHLEPSGLPQELIDRCAAFSVESNVAQSLIEAMGQLSSVYTDVESSLAEIQHLLSEEQENERIYLGQGKRPPSMILKELSLEASRYSEAHAKAADSNMLLHKAINSHLGNLRTLSLPLSEIQAQLPSIQILESSKDQAAIKELQRLLDKVEEMRKQRQMLYTQLREALQADDITKLATHQTDLEALFSQELAKHQRLTSLIEQNLSAQEKILVALTEANARYADTRRSTADIQQRRASTVAALLTSAEAYPDLTTKCQKGLEFYRKMDTNVTKLLQRLRSVCRVQQEEREQQEAARERVRPSHVTSPRVDTQDPMEQVQGGPKLKDFLHLMKKDRAVTESAFLPASSAPLPSSAGTESVQFSYPFQRPTPLGAEQSHAQPPYVSDGNSYYYNPSLSGGFHPSGPMYSGFPTDKSSTFSAVSSSSPASQPAASRTHSSYTYPSANQHAVPVSTVDSTHLTYPVSVPHPTSASLTHPTAGGYLGQSSSGASGQTIPPFSASAPATQPSMHHPTFPATSYYGQVSGTGHVAPYSASSLTMQQQTYPAVASHMGQPVGNVPEATVANSATQYQQQNYAASAYMGQQMNGGTLPASSYPSQMAASNANQQQTNTAIAPMGNTSSFTPASSAVPQQQTYGVAYMGNASSFSPASTAVSQQPTYGAATYTNQPTGGGLPSSVPYSTNASAGVTTEQQQPQYPYYPGSMYGYPPTSTTSAVPSIHQYPYGYSSSNANNDGSGGYQHGTTGTNNTAPSQSAGHQPPVQVPTASASGMGQYQHYPYYPNPVDPTNAYYPPGSYYPPNNSYTPAEQILQPTPLAPTPVPAPSAGQVASNLELLTLLDLSVPMAPTSALLEPQPRETPVLGNTQGTTTLTNSTTKAVMMHSAPAATSDSSKTCSITSPTESFVSKEMPIEVTIPPIAPTVPHKDPLADSDSASKLAADVEKLDKLVDGLTRKSLNGPTSLDTRWKEVLELQERETVRHSISVARCYPMKNRLPDVLPYDHNRVELPTTKDDYINASLVPALSPGAPSFIATQTPLTCTQQDFWTMIWQQQVEIVVCLLSDAEIPKPSPSTSAVYWPVEKGRDVNSGPWTITLQSSNIRPYCHERILGLTKNVSFIFLSRIFEYFKQLLLSNFFFQGEAKQRVLIHLQFTAWPGSSFPASPAQFLQLASEVYHFWQQQRSKSHPIVVHCLAGAGRTGLFCLLCTALSDLSSGSFAKFLFVFCHPLNSQHWQIMF